MDKNLSFVGANPCVRPNQDGSIKSRIYIIRGMHVMLDRDLAELYEVETKVLNQTVKRNSERFPEGFIFQLTEEEFRFLRSQFVTLKKGSGMYPKYLPFAFTEQGVSMLAGMLKSKKAIEISIKIINAFVEMRKFLLANAQIFQRLDSVEIKQLKTDKKLEKVLQAMEANDVKPKQGVFFDGQIFDAYRFVADLIRSARKSIVIIDNFIDDRVFMVLAKRKKNVGVTVFTRKITKEMILDLQKYNSQYPKVELKEIKSFHDRFIVLDDKEIYHFGASLKDLGLKCFAFSKLEIDSLNLLRKIR